MTSVSLVMRDGTRRTSVAIEQSSTEEKVHGSSERLRGEPEITRSVRVGFSPFA